MPTSGRGCTTCFGWSSCPATRLAVPTRSVAGFLGVSNLLPGRVESRASDYVTVRLPDDSRVRVPGAMVNGSATLDVGVRPEKIRLHESATSVPAGSNTLTARVVDASYLGV